MDSSRFSAAKESEQHREVSAAPTSLTTNIVSNPAPPRPLVVDRSKQRCFYATFVVLLLGLLLGCLVSFIFFIINLTNFDTAQGNHGFWKTCILFVKDKDVSAGVWSCDAVLGIKTLVILGMLAMIILHLILLCKGHSM